MQIKNLVNRILQASPADVPLDVKLPPKAEEALETATEIAASGAIPLDDVTEIGKMAQSYRAGKPFVSTIARAMADSFDVPRGVAGAVRGAREGMKRSAKDAVVASVSGFIYEGLNKR